MYKAISKGQRRKILRNLLATTVMQFLMGAIGQVSLMAKLKLQASQWT
jgi:hypothetical protein